MPKRYEQTNIRLSRELRERIKAQAKRERRLFSDTVRILIEDGLKRREALSFDGERQ